MIIVGEVGGEQEEKAAGFISRRMTNPLPPISQAVIHPRENEWVMQAQLCAVPPGRLQVKQEALRAAGAEVLDSPIHVAQWAKKHNLK